MQKLTIFSAEKKLCSRERGSILVVVVGIATLLSLGGVSLLQVCGSMHNQEMASKRNAFAFHAAESGVMMASNWLRNRTTFPSAGFYSPFEAFSMNGMWVEVAMDASVSPSGVRIVTIVSNVFDHPTERGADHFAKRIRCTIAQDDFGRYNLFVNKLLDPNWAGFGGGKVFHGRFHWNDPWLRMALNRDANNPSGLNGVGVTFTGDVTVANTQQSTAGGCDLNLTNGSGADFSHGLKFRDGSVGEEYVNAIFKKTFSSNTEQIAIPPEIVNFAAGSFGICSKIDLPASDLDEGTDTNDYRPTLTFIDDGTAVYSYRNGGSTATMTIPSIDRKILYCQTNLNVRGVALGNASVVTKKWKSIAVVGDLVYADNDLVTGHTGGEQNNYVPLNSRNCLALVSGYNIVFNPRWKETHSGPTQAIVGTLRPGSGKMYLNAELIMAHPDGVAGNWGMEWWITSSPHYRYQLQICGSHIMNYWRPTNNDQTHGGINVNYGYDQRFLLGLRPYGLPAINTVNNLWMVSMRNWQEENAY